MTMQIDLDPPYLVIKPGLTEEEFYRLANEDSDWEYLDGRIVMHSPASFEHESLFRFLLTLIGAYVDERGGGIVLGSRYPMRLDPLWSPEPDILFVQDSRRHLVTKNRLEGPADLVLEIVSEGTAHLLRREKLPRYRQAGIPEIWVVDPLDRSVSVSLRRESSYEELRASEGRVESSAIPGFWLDLAWIQEPRLRSPLSCISEILEKPLAP